MPSNNTNKLIGPNVLPKTDVRYIKWRASLKKRPAPWCMGLTKETSSSVNKISQTFKKKKIDNFAAWRERMRREGKIKGFCLDLPKDGELAELIGVILGDGHIECCARTESLMIFSNSRNTGFVERYAGMIERLFNKRPSIFQASNGSNCTRIRIYQKQISERLGISCGKRKNLIIKIPDWIAINNQFLIRYLRGLYEAEGNFCVHEPTGTYKFLFSNRNESLRQIVFCSLKKLGFHPHISGYQVQISRKEEVYKCKELLEFRKY